MAENKMEQVAMCGLLPSGYRCKKCGNVNTELECDSNGYYVKCEDCGHYVGGKNAKEALKNLERGKDGRK